MNKYYYLLNGKVMKGGEMPNITNPNNDSLIYGDTYIRRWISSLKPCEIDQRELEKIKNKVYTFNNCHADNPIDVTDIVEEIYCKCNCGESFIEFKQPKQVESEYDTEHKLFLESGKEYLLENFDILSCDVETHQIALIAIRKALKQTKNIYSIDDQNGAFAQMYKKAQNMDIFDFITMFSEKYEIFKNRK